MRKILYAGMLIMICNISYADIASTGYVDSAVATKQDTITDIATIRSGSAAGATAVRPEALDNYAKLDETNTFTQGQVISRSTEGAILKLTSGASNTNFLLERTGGSTCVLESGGSVGLFGTMTNHPLQIRTNYQARATVGTDGSFVLATDVASNSNDNQVATTKWVNSKLSPVAKSGSYNDLSNKPTIPTVPTNISSFTNDSGYITTSYHDSTKQDKLPNVPGNNGKYKLVWNSNTGQIGWEFEQFSLTCPSGTYDIGFSQCVDPSTNGTNSGYIIDSRGAIEPSSSNASEYGLTADKTWGVTFSYGVVKGISACSENRLEGRFADMNVNFSTSEMGSWCWCKMTEPAASPWVFSWMTIVGSGDGNACFGRCASTCAGLVKTNSGMRSVMFSAVGN